MSKERYSATDSNLKKAIRMLKSNGIKQTGKKVATYIKLHKKVDYMSWLKENDLSEEDYSMQQKKSREFAFQPLISIIMPLYNTPELYLIDMVESVMAQTYNNWEMCFADGSDNDNDLKKALDARYPQDKRLKYKKLDKNLGISENTNEALKLAAGEWIILGDHDDTFARDAFYEAVKKINEMPELYMVYTDEDKLKGAKYVYPHFKPDFNLDLLRSINYICHMLMVRRDVAQEICGFRKAYDGAQDYDFILRYIEGIISKEKLENLAELSRYIGHVPRAVYHWRIHEGSTAANLGTKNYAHEAGKKALVDHFERLGINAKVESGDDFAYYRTKYDISDIKKEYDEERNPVVSIIIPNKDHVDYLRKCIISLKKQNFQNFEVIIVENNSIETETFEYYNEIEDDQYKIVSWEGEFNYSAINNYGVTCTVGEYLLFLNNDTEMMDKDCLLELLSFAVRKEVGVVGARMYYGTGEIQHAGIFVGYEGRAGHLFAAMKEEEGIYFNRSKMAQDFSAVTAACMMVKADLYNKVQGFDEELKVALNDIDFCLRIRKLGYLVAYNPEAKLYHFESISRGLDDSPEKKLRFENEVRLFRERWQNILQNGDPYYNPNLTLLKADCSLRDKKVGYRFE